MILKGLLISLFVFSSLWISCNGLAKMEISFSQKSYSLKNSNSPLEVIIFPESGNLISQVYFDGKEMLHSPYITENNLPGKTLEGIPFLFPFANRLEKDFIPIGAKMHSIPPETKDLRRDKNGLLLHGFLYYQKGWELLTVQNATSKSYSDSRFIFDGKFLEAFPFPCTIKQELEMVGNSLTVTVTITNTGTEKLPLSFGFHPYFLAPPEWRKIGKISTNAKKVYEADKRLLPTGKLGFTESILTDRNLSELTLDHNFTDFPAREFPNSELSLAGRKIRLELLEGFDHILLFTPSDKNFVCMEPMFGPVNAFYLHKKGLYPNLRFLNPNKEVKASFRLSFYTN